MNRKISTIWILCVLLIVFLVPLAEAQVCLYVPYFSQLDQHWAGNQLGTCPGVTIGQSGCAITSVAMVFKFYKADIDPARLNEWLKKNKGYTNGCLLIWSAPLCYGGNLVLESDIWTKKLQDMNTYLDRQEPVIAQVLFKGLTHYVVVTYRYNCTYYINDPNGSGKTLGYYNNTIGRFLVYSLPYCRLRGAPPRANGSLATTWGQ